MPEMLCSIGRDVERVSAPGSRPSLQMNLRALSVSAGAGGLRETENWENFLEKSVSLM